MLEFLSPSSLAQVQDEILQIHPGAFERPGILQHFRRRLEKFVPMLTAGEISGLLPANNLKLRNLLILAGLCDKGDKAGRSALMDEASRLFRSLLYQGNVYSEGLSYLEYVQAAVAFAVAQGVDAAFLAARVAGAMSVFEKLAAPDGTVPFSDTRSSSRFAPPPAAPGWTRLPGYSVYRIREAYLFISHNPEIVNHRKNQHVAPDFGHFAFWRAGVWIVGHPWYTGYKEKKARPRQERDYLNVPRGNWNSPLWRWLLAPRLRVSISEKEIRLRFDEQTERIFEFGSGYFVVEDVVGKNARQALYSFGY